MQFSQAQVTEKYLDDQQFLNIKYSIKVELLTKHFLKESFFIDFCQHAQILVLNSVKMLLPRILKYYPVYYF